MNSGAVNLVNIFYPIETVLKVAFIVMSPFNVRFTLLAAFLASLFGMLRVLKRPQFNKEYLAKVFLNNHGQNILYISFGALGFVNYLYYSPIVLFFAYNIVEFLKIKFPSLGFNQYGDMIRLNKFWVYEGKCKLELFFFFYLIFSLPLDFMGRAIKAFMMGQFLFIKYRLSSEFRYTCTSVNNWIENKTAAIGFINSAYKKLAEWIYSYATRELVPQQPQAEGQAQS